MGKCRQKVVTQTVLKGKDVSIRTDSTPIFFLIMGISIHGCCILLKKR